MTIETTTSGEIIIKPDFCIYCDMSTGGTHEAHCPLYGGD